MSGPRLRVLAAAYAAVPGPGASSPSLLTLIDGLRADLDLVTVKTEDLSHIKRIHEARMFRVPVGAGTPAEQQRVYARAFGRQLDSESYGVVHVLDPWAGEAAAERRKARGLTLLYEIASFPDPERESESAWLAAHARTLAAADRVIVPTRAAASALESRGLRVEVVRPAVDLGAYDWGEAPRGRTPRVLYLGSFSPTRNLETFLRAIEIVCGQRAIRALIAGDGDQDRRLRMRSEVSALGMGDIVEVRGEPSLRAVPGLIAAADVCVAMASDRRVDELVELPHPLLEHLACYRPLIAADVPGVAELVREEHEALLFAPGDANALADAILEILRDSGKRERLVDAGYQRVQRELSGGARRRRLARLYEELAPGTQIIDTWGERFEEVPTGIIDLSTLDSEETPTSTQPPAGTPRDTSPGLVLPDTDPGRS